MEIPLEVSCFWKTESRAINKARWEHFESLNLDINNKSILETDSGGCGDFTINLLNYTNNITLNDPRQNNIEFVKKRIKKDLSSNNWDLNNDLPSVQKFDIIFSYGTIYHLHKPIEAIKNLSNLCNDMFIISMQCNGDNYGMISCLENGFDQSITGYGCRCGRYWVHEELKKYFPYVYFPIDQPNHPEFPKNWNNSLPLKGTVRFVIIASRKELNNNKLTPIAPDIYK